MSTWRTLREHPELWERYFIREKVIAAIRRFFQDRQFHEIETPLLIARPPAESYLDVFETTLFDRNRNPQRAYLSTSPEVSLKKLIVAGLGDCFSLTKSFRNMETQSNLHNPEFTMIEWYRVGASYTNIMEDCEELILYVNTYLRHLRDARDAQLQTKLIYQGRPVDLSRPWDRVSVIDAFAKWAKVDFEAFLGLANAKRISQEKGYTVDATTTWEQLYNQIFLNEVEPHLGRGKPTILFDFPAAMAALCRRRPDSRFAERFEFYIEGLELGDCYGELTDATEQEERFKKEMMEIARLGKTSYEYDHDFIDALRVGLPQCSGIAVGIDRLVMLFADVTDIADVLFFPGRELFEENL